MTSRQISRKEFLGIGAGAAAGFALAGSAMGTFLAPEAGAAPMTLTPFMVQLPVPPVLTGATQSLDIEQTLHSFHPDLTGVKVWGYNGGAKTGGYLGPTIEVKKGATTTVSFTNKLPDTHLLPVTEVLVPGEDKTTPRILTHLHGGFVSGDNDGNPYATETLFFKEQPTQTVVYPPQPRATTLWYHDHALGMTRLNVYAGLAGFFLVRDNFDTGKEPNPIGIPGGRYEVPIVIQDKSFNGGQQFYSPDDTWMPEFFGDTPVINGAVQPYLTVEPRMYRLRFLNGSQSRFYNLELDGGVPFYQIGSEGGMFDRPVQMNRILLLPAERADVIVDFRGLAGQSIVLKNAALPDGVVSPAEPVIPELMQFRVRGPATTPGPRAIPIGLNGGAKANLANKTSLKTRYITLEEVLDEDTGEPLWLQMNGDRFDAPVKEKPKAGTIEDWAFVNISADTHPIHMHLTNFQVIKRQALEGGRYLTALEAARDGAPGSYPLLGNKTIDPTPFLVGPAIPPDANERGWKDTVRANPDQVTWIRQKFDLPVGVSAPQKYVYHCHILEHEENDMMRPYDVVV